MYYYYHPESESIWCQEKEEEFDDGHVVELNKKEAFRLATGLGLKKIPKH